MFVARDNAFLLMSSVKGTPAYWKQFFFDVLSMVKQLRISTYFMKLSCTGVRSEEIPHIISKLNNFELNEEELKDLSYQERCSILNNSPVLAEVPVQWLSIFQRSSTWWSLGENKMLCCSYWVSRKW